MSSYIFLSTFICINRACWTTQPTYSKWLKMKPLSNRFQWCNVLILSVSVRIFQQGYLYTVTQHLLTRRNFWFSNSPKGFWRSLAEISLLWLLYLLFILSNYFNDNGLSFYSPCQSTKLRHQFSQFIRPNNFKYTILWPWNTNEKFIEMNAILLMITWIAIFHCAIFGQAFDSQCNNEDIFQVDSRGKQCAKEVLCSNQANFTWFFWNQKQTTAPFLSDFLPQSQMTVLLLLWKTFCPD